MRYAEGRERIHLSVFSDESVSRVKRVNVCASGKADYDWLNADVCVSRRGGRLRIDPLTSPQAAVQFTVSTYGREVMSSQEHVGVIALDVRNRPVGAAIIHKGGEASSMVDPRSLFRVVLLLPATGFIVWHSHPSEDPGPSQDDIAFTRALRTGADALSLRFIDSLVITPDPTVYSSLVELGHVRR